MIGIEGYQLKKKWELLNQRTEATPTNKRHISASERQISKIPILGGPYDWYRGISIEKKVGTLILEDRGQIYRQRTKGLLNGRNCKKNASFAARGQISTKFKKMVGFHLTMVGFNLYQN